MMSTFTNDLFSLNMETKKFYPIALHMSSKKKTTNSKEGEAKLSLEQELAQLKLGKGADKSSSDEESSDDDDDEATQTADASAETAHLSYTKNSKGQILPHRRMDAALTVQGHHLYVFGGQYEVGKKEITLVDLFSLNLNLCDTYVAHCAQDMGKLAWAGDESDSDAGGSWESGSTVVSAVMDGDRGDLSDEEEEEEMTAADTAADAADAPSDAIPMEMDNPHSMDDLGPSSRTTGGNKRGMKVHKAQLLAQLAADAAVPTPLSLEETNEEFYERTHEFWLTMAAESLFGVSDPTALSSRDRKRCRNESVHYAASRHEEATILMEQLRIVEEREKEEEAYFKEMRERKKREWDEELAKQNQQQQQEDESDPPAAVPVGGDATGNAGSVDESSSSVTAAPTHRTAVPVKGILKSDSKPTRSVQIA